MLFMQMELLDNHPETIFQYLQTACPSHFVE